MKHRSLNVLPPMPADVARAEALARSGGPFDPERIAPPVLRLLVRRTVETVPRRLTISTIEAAGEQARLNGIVSDLIADAHARDPFALWRPCDVAIRPEGVVVNLTHSKRPEDGVRTGDSISRRTAYMLYSCIPWGPNAPKRP